MFKIVQVLDTDYPISNDREELQTIADELNQDALASDTSERWIIIQTAVWGSLQEGEAKS
jgi:hypothetical protein